MTPDEHAAEAERIVRDNMIPNTHYAALVHALLATRPTPPSMEEAAARVDAWRAAYPTPLAELTDGPTPGGYQRAVTAKGFAIWQHQATDEDEPCGQVKSSRYFPSNRLSASGEIPPEYCPCQGRESRTEPATWLPVYVLTTET